MSLCSGDYLAEVQATIDATEQELKLRGALQKAR
jgi:hypothetical protein